MSPEDASEFRKKISVAREFARREVSYERTPTMSCSGGRRTRLWGEMPTFTPDWKHEIQPRLNRLSVNATMVRQAFDMVVFDWLSDLAWFGRKYPMRLGGCKNLGCSTPFMMCG